VNVVPLFMAVVTVMVPPCDSMMRLHMAKPKPIPCALVVNSGEKIFGKISSGIPVPVSVKVISTL
jgi:hypothetical protein